MRHRLGDCLMWAAAAIVCIMLYVIIRANLNPKKDYDAP